MQPKKWLNGKDYYPCTSWKELEEALGKMSVPIIIGASFSSKEGLTTVDVADEIKWEPEKYDWSKVGILCQKCGWFGIIKDLVYEEKKGTESCPKCGNILETNVMRINE